jgi:hypothetical protein
MIRRATGAALGVALAVGSTPGSTQERQTPATATVEQKLQHLLDR